MARVITKHRLDGTAAAATACQGSVDRCIIVTIVVVDSFHSYYTVPFTDSKDLVSVPVSKFSHFIMSPSHDRLTQPH